MTKNPYFPPHSTFCIHMKWGFQFNDTNSDLNLLCVTKILAWY